MGDAKPSPMQDERFMYIAVLGVGYFLLKKVTPKIYHFYYTHKVLCIGSAIFICAFVVIALGTFLWNHFAEKSYEKEITAEDPRAVLLGTDESNATVYLKESFRRSHTQVIGTTTAGKTESIILPWIIKDLENGSGCLIIDGKSDKEFLNKLYAYVVKLNRKKDFKFFSLVDVERSQPFNPFVGGTPEEISERIFSSFPIEHPHFRAIQSNIFLGLTSLATHLGKSPNFSLIHRLLTDTEYLKAWVDQAKDPDIKRRLTAFTRKPDRERETEVSGLEANLSPFALGHHAKLFNSSTGGIDFNEVLRKNQICYFQLPTMLYPFLGEATGKLVLQSFQSAIAKRHVGHAKKKNFFSCYLDDFQDYIYRGFGALLNKSRSANVGIVFCHQALGDLDRIGPDFRNIVLTNTNCKVVMRNNDPQTCEHFAKSFGTRTTEKRTERRSKGALGETNTGEGSVRDVEEYIYHPNIIKQLGVGEGIVSIPHPKGVKIAKLKFAMQPNLPEKRLPVIKKANVDTDTTLNSVVPSEKEEPRA